MRSSTKSEIRMLREMIWHFGTITKCRFCKKPLLEAARNFQYGARDFPPVKERLAIHHEDEVRGNNDASNRKPAHSKCHKSYHAKKAAAERRLNGKLGSGSGTGSGGNNPIAA